MKAILLFVAAGCVRESDRIQAAAIAQETGKKVVFRNATIAAQTSERPEDNEGVAGAVPEAYAGFTRYVAGEAPKEAAPVQMPQGDLGALNALGLPEGHPDNRETLKAALSEHGVEFHPNAKTPALVDLYRARWFPEPVNGENGQD